MTAAGSFHKMQILYNFIFVSNPLSSFVLFDNTTQWQKSTLLDESKKMGIRVFPACGTYMRSSLNSDLHYRPFSLT